MIIIQDNHSLSPKCDELSFDFVLLFSRYMDHIYVIISTQTVTNYQHLNNLFDICDHNYFPYKVGWLTTKATARWRNLGS